MYGMKKVKQHNPVITTGCFIVSKTDSNATGFKALIPTKQQASLQLFLKQLKIKCIVSYARYGTLKSS